MPTRTTVKARSVHPRALGDDVDTDSQDILRNLQFADGERMV
ncbi:hypothetical protein J2852_001113 [Azospirillum soli]|nr:hypothetical protein [Azospirillum soli]